MIGVLTLTMACCLGWIGHYRSIDKRAQLEWIEMSFFGTAALVFLNTKVGDWSVLEWIMGLCAVVVLYGAGIGASMCVEKLLRRENKDPSPRTQPPVESNGAQA